MHQWRCPKLRGAAWQMWKQLTFCLVLSLQLASSKPVCAFLGSSAFTSKPSFCASNSCSMLGPETFQEFSFLPLAMSLKNSLKYMMLGKPVPACEKISSKLTECGLESLLTLCM